MSARIHQHVCLCALICYNFLSVHSCSRNNMIIYMRSYTTCFRLFNCAHCEYGSNNKGVVEEHVTERHPAAGVRSRIVKQDACLKHVQPFKTIKDGTEILGIPVLTYVKSYQIGFISRLCSASCGLTLR